MAPVRAARALVVGALVAGCATTAKDFHEYRLEGFAEAYRAARVVVVVPPYAEVREHFQSVGDVLRVDWSQSGFENLAAALQSELGSRGLEVFWVEEAPGNAARIQEVREAFAGVVAEHGGLSEFRDHQFAGELRAPLGAAMGKLLQEEDGDLLVVAQAGGVFVAKRTPSAGEMFQAFLLQMVFGIQEQDPAATGAWLRVAVADRAGRVVYLGAFDAGGHTLRSPKTVAAMVEGALEGFPVEDGTRKFGEVCVLDAECAVGLFCPYGRCVHGEPPALDPEAAAAAAAADAARREASRVARAERAERARRQRIEERGATAPQWQSYWKCVELRGAAASFYCQDEMAALQAACDAAGGYPTWEDCRGVPP